MIPLLEGAGHTVEGVDLMFDDEQLLHERIASGQIRLGGCHGAAPQQRVGCTLDAPIADPSNHPNLCCGRIATLNPNAALDHTGADFAVVGPPEETVADLVDAQDPRVIEGVVHAGQTTRSPVFIPL